MIREEKGQLALLKVQQRALQLAWLTSLPTTPCRYDLVLDDKTRLWRVQVKYGARASGNSAGAIRVDLRRHGKVYTRDEIDAVVVYIPATEQICWLNSDIFHGKEDLYLRYEPAKNGQRSGCLFTHDYVW